VKSDGSGVDIANVKMSMNPFDEIAVEEAIRLKEKGQVTEIVAISIGPQAAQETLRTALAMGADNAIHVELPETADNFMSAKALAGALKKEAKVDVVYTGKEAIDDGAAQTSQLIAEFADYSCVTVALNIEYSATGIKAKREVEGGAFEMIEAPFPVVIAAQKGLNEPRYASLPNIMKAKKKEVKTLKAADVGVSDADQRLRFKSFQLPPPKPPGKKIAGDPATQAKELIRLLHEEAKVI
jgi:electron transfer flavoprotein beta subunit